MKQPPRRGLRPRPLVGDGVGDPCGFGGHLNCRFDISKRDHGGGGLSRAWAARRVGDGLGETCGVMGMSGGGQRGGSCCEGLILLPSATDHAGNSFGIIRFSGDG